MNKQQVKQHTHTFTVNVKQWCVPPIGSIQRKLIPPQGTPDWERIAFQPMLSLCLWVCAVLVIVIDQFQPGVFEDEHAGSAFWVRAGLSLVCPPLAMVSLWLIQSPSGARKYQGLWVRLAADVGQLTAITMYAALRFLSGDWHIYPMGTVVAAVIFVAHLVMRDAKRILVVEKLASKIHQKEFLRDAGA